MAEVLPLTPALAPAAAVALARAFDADPAFVSLWPDTLRRARALRRFLSIPLAEARHTACGEVLRVDGRVVGAAVWVPPGRYPFGAAQQARAAPRMLGVAAAAPGGMRRLARFGANLDAAFPADRPWYLIVVGVAPEAQGRGLGTRLLAPGLARCDASGAGCYLETDTAAAARLYERLGFEVLETGAQLLPDGPTHWRMRRQPAAGVSSTLVQPAARASNAS